jgi:hypothetical protein
MEWKTSWNDPLTRYLAPFHELIGEKRTRTTFDETIRGIMGAGSLICQQIAAHSAVLAKVKKGRNASCDWPVERARSAPNWMGSS